MKSLIFNSFLICIVNTTCIYAQRIGFKHDWQNVIKKYNTLDCVEVSTTYYLFDSHTSTKHTDITKGNVSRKGKDVYQSIDNMEYIVNESFMAMIDHDDKVIVFDRSLKGFSPLTPEINMDYLKEFIRNEKSSMISKTVKQYEVTFEDQEIEKLVINFFPATMLLQDITIYYAEHEDVDDENKPVKVKQKLKIVFGTPMKIGNHFYTIENNPYFTFLKDKFAATAKYRNYEVIDNRINFSKK